MPYFTNRGIIPLPTAPSGCTEADDFIARTTGFSGADEAAYTDLICGLVTDGVWALTDVLQIYAAPNFAASLLNLKSTSYAATLIAPTSSSDFTAYEGYTFTGTQGINTQFNTSTGTNYLQDSASFGVWMLSYAGSTVPILFNSAGGGGITDIYPYYSADSKLYTRLHDSTFDGATNADGTGFSLGVRTNSSDRQSYKDGVLNFSNTGITSQTPPNGTILVDGSVAGQIAVFYAGGELDATQQLALYNCLSDYLTVVGAI